MQSQDYIEQAKRIVIKIGSALLLDEQGQIRQAWLDSIVADIKALQSQGKEVVLVCSGSVPLGRAYLHLHKHDPLPKKQAAGAIGQIQLAHAYHKTLANAGLVGAQLLLTLYDSEDRQRYLNASNTLEVLLSHGVVPVINENDTVSTSELRIGDNDRLAARVAQMVAADVLVFFSDVAGLYTANPNTHPEAKLIPVVTEITPEIEASAGDVHSAVGTGGMQTKIIAAKIAMQSGCHLVITMGAGEHPIQTLISGAECTWFLAQVSPRSARKQWLAHQLKPKGDLVIDSGAENALLSGKSLLAVGISSCSGDFQKGDPIQVLNAAGKVLAIGLSNYPQKDLHKILGKHSNEVEPLLHYSNGDAVVHRDNLALKDEA